MASTTDSIPGEAIVPLDGSVSVENNNNGSQLTPVLTVACRILRSPSHESVTTDLSLFSVSSVASDGQGGKRLLGFGRCEHRGHSPNPDSAASNRHPDIPEILWFEEETELIRSCAALSQAVGLQKSFSTSDISQLPCVEDGSQQGGQSLRNAVSEIALNSLQRSGFLLEHARLDHTSRSCSTWVAVGDIASTSQLPSPHGGQSTSTTQCNAPPPNAETPPPAFTAVDFIRSVNKKVRQNYIRRRLLTTYKALERLSQSEFNLDRLEVNPSLAANSVNTESNPSMILSTGSSRLCVPGSSPLPKPSTPTNSTNAAMLRVAKQRASKNLPLTIRDVERERGKPLSKYERNMMIFNWLHTLDETTMFVEGIQ